MIDYMVMEAVALRVRRDEREAEKKAERDQWKREGKENLSKFT